MERRCGFAPDFYVIRNDGRPVYPGQALGERDGRTWRLAGVLAGGTEAVLTDGAGDAIVANVGEFGARIYGPNREVFPALAEGEIIKPQWHNGVLSSGYEVDSKTGGPASAWRRLRFHGDWLGEAPNEAAAWALACYHNARWIEHAKP